MRATLGLTAIAAGAVYLLSPDLAALSKWSLGPALVVAGGALAIGFLTPLAGTVAGLCFLGIALGRFSTPLTSFHDTQLMAFGIVVTAMAIVLLGPGAFSVDSYLFGRREIVIPPPARHPQE